MKKAFSSLITIILCGAIAGASVAVMFMPWFRTELASEIKPERGFHGIRMLMATTMIFAYYMRMKFCENGEWRRSSYFFHGARSSGPGLVNLNFWEDWGPQGMLSIVLRNPLFLALAVLFIAACGKKPSEIVVVLPDGAAGCITLVLSSKTDYEPEKNEDTYIYEIKYGNKLLTSTLDPFARYKSLTLVRSNGRELKSGWKELGDGSDDCFLSISGNTQRVMVFYVGSYSECRDFIDNYNENAWGLMSDCVDPIEAIYE